MTHDGTAGAVTSPAYVAILQGVRCLVPAVADGGLLVFFLDRAGVVILRVALDEGTRHVDELFLRHLTAMVADIDATAVVLASVRADGQPRRADRLLWREMQQRLADGHTSLADLLVIGDDRCWSAATRRRLRQAVTAPG